MSKDRKVLVLGLDSVPPELLYGEFKDRLPNIEELLDNSVYGSIHSCHPPITIPAWMVMMTSKNPGRLGLYGFRHRKGFSYSDFYIANSYSVKEPTVWDHLSRNGKYSCLISIPPSYPPKPVNGHLISCFITPSSVRDYTYPAELKGELESRFGPYSFDIEFRTENRREILRNLYEMTEKRFKVIKYLMKNKKWDFLMFVEIGLDRMHHAFWKFFDKTHFKYEPGNEFENVIPEYYAYIDEQIGELLKIAGKDTLSILVSDHGTKGMKGAFCINEWLAEKNYLKYKRKPDKVSDLEKNEIDWSQTSVWGWGGYYARVFFNIKGREPNGVINPEDFRSFREELTIELKEIKDPSGRRMDTKVFKPEDIYTEPCGDPPDLLVYFDNFYWRSAGTVGHKKLYLDENDKGPDDSVHGMDGVFTMHDPEKTLSKKRLDNLDIRDIAPTVLNCFNLPIPTGMEGKKIEG